MLDTLINVEDKRGDIHILKTTMSQIGLETLYENRAMTVTIVDYQDNCYRDVKCKLVRSTLLTERERGISGLKLEIDLKELNIKKG